MSKHGIYIDNEEIINDKYKVLTHVATGGMSEVYLVEEVDDPSQTWAVKVANTTDKLARKLVDETKILSELDHPNLPKIVDFFQVGGYFYLVMEYARGAVLSDYFEANDNQLAIDLVVNIGIQLCDCLSYLHTLMEPVIYRDIKPGNIILKNDGTLMLIDFGIARRYQEDKLKDTVRIGTVGFAAPEQFEKKQTDSRTDLFSLGALLFYLISGGKYVYTSGKDTKVFMKKTPKTFRKCVKRLVELEPANRLQRASEARALLVQAKEDLVAKTVYKRHFLLYTLLVSSILIVGGVYGLYLVMH